MLIGFVSDERYVALPDVLLEFEGEAGVFEARSGARGSVRFVGMAWHPSPGSPRLHGEPGAEVEPAPDALDDPKPG